MWDTTTSLAQPIFTEFDKLRDDLSIPLDVFKDLPAFTTGDVREALFETQEELEEKIDKLRYPSNRLKRELSKILKDVVQQESIDTINDAIDDLLLKSLAYLKNQNFYITNDFALEINSVLQSAQA